MAPGTASSVTPPPSKPAFASYLLPSFKFPFRRRPTDASQPSDVPSLGSSLESSVASSPASSPPSSLPTYLTAVSGDSKDGPLPTLAGAGLEDKPVTNPGKRLSSTAADTIRCSTCSTDLAFSSQIVSKGFTGRHGRAYLVSPPSNANAAAGRTRDLHNIRVGSPESRQLVTGWHVVADISCGVCCARLGWKYVSASEASQMYKVGKFILEMERVVAFRTWEDVDFGIEGCDDYDLGDGACYSGKGVMNDEEEVDDEGGGGKDEISFDSDDEDECEDIFAGTWDPVTVAKRRRLRTGEKET